MVESIRSLFFHGLFPCPSSPFLSASLFLVGSQRCPRFQYRNPKIQLLSRPTEVEFHFRGNRVYLVGRGVYRKSAASQESVGKTGPVKASVNDQSGPIVVFSGSPRR